jgi:outer membrane protein assembly factor BamB
MDRFRFCVAAAVLCLASIAPLAAEAAPDGWPELLHDAAHSSLSPDQQVNAANGNTLGINWMAPLRAADLGSPVTAYNGTLGATVAYVGDERGDVLAFNTLNGQALWSTSVGFNDAERATPMVAPDGSVWVATALDAAVYKLDGATGKVLCSLKVPERIDSSFVFATPPGGAATVYTAEISVGNLAGPVIAIAENNCKLVWAFTKWAKKQTGAWATPAFGIDASGNGRIYIGASTPDDGMYALDALTGQMLWRFNAFVPGDNDIGSAATVSPPGNNGFADGVLYFHSKYGIMYAADLTTGTLIWEYYYARRLAPGGVSSAALTGTTLVYGVADGSEALDARTGKLLWHHVDPNHQEVYSSPAIAGPAGKQIAAYGDSGGAFNVVRVTDGKQLYLYQTGNYITSSAAIVDNDILIASTDGFLYDFTVNGGNVSPPTTSISYPMQGSQVPNPGGNLTITGAATDATGLASVIVSVQSSGPNGPWYDATSGTWVSGAFDNVVPVQSPGAKQSTWSFALPVPSSGSSYVVTTNAVDVAGVVDRIGAQSAFSVNPNPQSPQLALSVAIAPPATVFTATASGFTPSETVQFTLQAKVVASGKASPKGVVKNIKIHVPASASFGPSAVTATGETSHLSTTAPVDITNVWTQVASDPARSGYEPNDPVLKNTVAITGRDGFLAQAWLFTTNSAAAAAPAVVGGSAYVTNKTGTLFALDTASGAPFWTYTIPSNAAIRTTPAVGNGDVVFGADDETIYRVAASTGAPIGSETLDGIPTSPALADGKIFVGTTNGTIYAIDESTGTTLWSQPVGAAIDVAPALDSAKGLVIVGDAGGHVTALAAKTGKRVYAASTGGAQVTAPPSVSSGKIFVGASDGILRAFNESSGHLDWSYNAGAAIDAVALAGVDAFAGTARSLVEVRQADGKQISNVHVGGGVTGIANTIGVTVIETADGNLELFKDAGGLAIKFQHHVGDALATQPVILDGTVYVSGPNGLYAFTNHGQAPEDLREHRLLLQLREHQHVPAAWRVR